MSSLDNPDATHVLKTGDTMTGALTINGLVDTPQLTVQATSTQTTDILDIKNSVGSVITRLDHQGYFSSNSTTKTNVFTVKSGGTVNLTGTTTANNTNTIINGIGTKFTTELGMGDQVAVSSNSGTYVVVASIASDTQFTMAVGAPSIGDGTVQTMTAKKALFVAIDSSGNPKFVVLDSGLIGVGGQLNIDEVLSTAGNIRLNGHSLYLDTDNSEVIVKSSGINGAGIQFVSFGGFQLLTTSGGNKTDLWVDYTGVGIKGVTSPTALLHIAAGTTTASTAPLKFTAGTNLTTAETGAVEYNGNYYLTNGGLVRFPLGGTLFDHFTDVGNTHTDGATFDDLYSDTTIANTFNSNGDKVTAEYSGIFVASGTATREIKVLFAGTTILDTGTLTTATADSWDIRLIIIRESSTIVRCQATIVASTTLGAQAFNDTTYTRITGLTLSGTNILKVQAVSGGVGAAASDIVAKLASVAFSPAA